MKDTYWNYRIWRIHLDDGAVYGMKETFYQDVNGQQLIQFWDAEPHWIEQDANDFLPTIDRYEQGGTEPNRQVAGPSPHQSAYKCNKCRTS